MCKDCHTSVLEKEGSKREAERNVPVWQKDGKRKEGENRDG